MIAAFHENLSNGRWGLLSLSEQLANIGSEVSRSIRWRQKDPKIFQNTCDRALELFDLTLSDPRWNFFRLREIARVRELFCWTIFAEPFAHTTLEDLDRYFLYFAFLVREKR